MKKLLTYICMLAFAASFTSCEKEIMNYEGVDGLYFDVRWVKTSETPTSGPTSIIPRWNSVR